MSLIRSGTPGATRVCPHCKATVLESAAVCPGCRHHLRFGGTQHALEPGEGYSALSVDGTIAHTRANEPCEYCVVLDVRDERGQQITRQVVGVGVLQVGERRRLNVSVEMMPVRAAGSSKTAAPAKAPGAAAAATATGTAAPAPRPAAAASTAAPANAAAASAKPAQPAGTTGPQQPANLISSGATSASMKRLGVITPKR